jgi:hypothetical protein
MPETSPDSYKLLLIIAALGGDMVPLDAICRRLQSEQKRWTTHGEVDVLTPSEAGLDTHLQTITSTRISELMAELPFCITYQTPRNFRIERCYTIISPYREKITRHACMGHGEFVLQILRLICFVFPRERLWEQE